jgi:hypothetical protein
VQRGVFRRDSVEINRPTFLAGGARAQLLNRIKSTTYCRCCAGVARDRGKWAGEGASGAARGRVPGEETWLCHCCATIAIKSSWNLDFSYSKEHLSQRAQPNQLFRALWRPEPHPHAPPRCPKTPRAPKAASRRPATMPTGARTRLARSRDVSLVRQGRANKNSTGSSRTQQ